jgi:hypothetical protein
VFGVSLPLLRIAKHVKAISPLQTVQIPGSQRTLWTTNDPEPLRDRWAGELLAHEEYR